MSFVHVAPCHVHHNHTIVVKLDSFRMMGYGESVAISDVIMLLLPVTIVH